MRGVERRSFAKQTNFVDTKRLLIDKYNSCYDIKRQKAPTPTVSNRRNDPNFYHNPLPAAYYSKAGRETESLRIRWSDKIRISVKFVGFASKMVTKKKLKYHSTIYLNLRQ